MFSQVADVVDKFAALEKRKKDQWKIISQASVTTKTKKFVKKNKGSKA